MAQTIKLRRSATQGGTPTVSQLSLGEVAINTYDGKMYIKKDSGTASIVEIGGGNLPLTGGSLSGTLTIANTYPRINLNDTDSNPDWSIINANGVLNFYDQTNAANRLSLASSGNVGIGTNVPGAKLHVIGAIASEGGSFTSNIDTASDAGLVIPKNDFIYSDDTNYLRRIIGHTSTGLIEIGQGGTSLITDIILKPGSTGNVRFFASGSEDVRINASGNVGIGTSAPTDVLEISKQLSAQQTVDFPLVVTSRDDGNSINQLGGEGVGIKFRLANNSASTPATSFVGGGIAAIRENQDDANSTTSLAFYTSQNDETLDRYMTIRSTGNVGIGTTSPTSQLHLHKDAGTAYLKQTNTANGQTLEIGNAYSLYTGANGAHSAIASDQVLAFATADAERMRITAAGNVGIGSSSPAAKLQVEELGIDTTTTSTTAVTQVAIDSMVAATFRSARYTIQVTNSTDSTYHLTEMLLIHDGTTPSISEFGTIFTGSAAEAAFTADINSGNVRILATPASTDAMAFKVVRHSITV
jgi:hypothetical protein